MRHIPTQRHFSKRSFSPTALAGFVVVTGDGRLHTLRDEIPSNAVNAPLRQDRIYGVFDLLNGRYFGYLRPTQRSTSLKLKPRMPYGLRPLRAEAAADSPVYG
jgi:hypothetical protein